MKNLSNMYPKWCNWHLGLLLIRIAVGAVFLTHGISKLSNIAGTVGFFGKLGLAPFWAYVVAIVETLGGAAVLLGILVVPASLLLAIIMLVAIFTAKWKMGFSGGYEYEATLLAVLLALTTTGAGKYAISRGAGQQGGQDGQNGSTNM